MLVKYQCFVTRSRFYSGKRDLILKEVIAVFHFDIFIKGTGM